MKQETGLPIVSELIDLRHLDAFLDAGYRRHPGWRAVRTILAAAGRVGTDQMCRSCSSTALATT